MTREEIKDLLKFIIRKCDLVINNENYTADEYAQDKIEDIAEMCHRVLDGQFGEIIEPFIPSNIDEAALKELQVYLPQGNGPDGICYFIAPQMLAMYKAGAEWMAGQGIKIHIPSEALSENTLISVKAALWSLFHSGCKEMVVQIRKK